MMTAKPYKKRLLSSLNAHLAPMEVDCSDGTERHQSTSPSSQEESEKDTSKEPLKTRKGWKKKVCRKQFRHHNIAIFKPGTNPSTCLLKKKEKNPALIKKLESPAQKESIIDPILHSLAGQKTPPHHYKETSYVANQIDVQKLTSIRLERSIAEKKYKPSYLKQPSIEEINNNRLDALGRHNLPAIINETPAVRRKSIENSWTPTNETRRVSIDMPLLLENKQIPSNKEINCQTNDNLAKQVKQEEKHRQWTIQYEIERSKYKSFQEESFYLHHYQSNSEEYSRIQKQNIPEVPVDLSIKTPQDLSLKNVKNYNKIERSSPKQNPYTNEKKIEGQWSAPTPTHVLPSKPVHPAVYQQGVQQASASNSRKVIEEIYYHHGKINQIIHRDFSIYNLTKLCQSYRRLVKILHHSPAIEVEANVENIRNETFRYISSTLKNVHLDPINVINILGTTEATKEKEELLGYLNKLFHNASNIPIQSLFPKVPPKSSLVFPKEKATDLRYQKKIEELYHPQNHILTPNLSHKYLEIEIKDLISNWRRNSELLTPSPTSPTAFFQPTQPTAIEPKEDSVNHPALIENDRISPDRPNSLPNINNLMLTEAAAIHNNNEGHSIKHVPPIERPKHSTDTQSFLDEKKRIKTIKLGSVIVADTSMQITKEPVKKMSRNGENKKDKDKYFQEPQKMEIGNVPEEKNNTEKEFINIIEKLKSKYPKEKLTELLLDQLNNTCKKRKVIVENPEPIEITDSDNEDSKKEALLAKNRISRTKYYTAAKRNKSTKRMPDNLTISRRKSEDNKILHNVTSTTSTMHPTSQKYSPEIEPISPVEDEVFHFPEVSKNNIVSKDTVIQYRENPNTTKIADTTGLPRIKRQKSEEKAKVPPHGKLCYIREQNIFLRYFDESEAKLFEKNSVLGEEESIKTKIKLNKDTPPSEKIQIPPQVEFSYKEDIPEPPEFLHELKLVEQFVPKDFAAFYRFVTGYQIVRNKNPVSLQTFLMMYNTNGITELLKKYLNTTEGDQMVPF